MLVMFYSYYKQATTGPCNTPKPNSWDPIGKMTRTMRCTVTQWKIQQHKRRYSLQ
uniref:ACB domain-containing protein n=1 Tax=Sinocyclocheilus rhinocerous TaxID=307959 RepID=A0A673LG18_9TELE